MKMHGKILLFKPDEGKGIIINSSREKIVFNIENWDDFDAMPTLGMEIVFNQLDEKAFDIVSKENEDKLRENEDKINTEQETESTEIEKKEEVEEETEDSEETKQVSEKETENSENSEKQAEAEETESSNEDEEHFDSESVISILDGLSEELEEERPESITNSLNVATAVSNYFNVIKLNIDRRKNYKKADGRLDYRLIRRFIWTTYNNLTDIDIDIITPKIKIICDDLKDMENIYDDFVRKTRHPSVAYEEVFLSCQAEYQKIREGAENVIQKLTQLKANEKIIGGNKEIKKQELESEIKTKQFDILKEELKSLNGAYVDVVHMMAELDERYKNDMQLLKDFESEYREDFYKIFSKKADEYEFDLVDILNAQAFIFDMQQWHQAKKSKAVRLYFKSSSVTGELNTKTYLKYYLSTQDSEKATDETKKLFELYEYLTSVQKDYIVIVVSDSRDAIDYEMAIHDVDKSYDVKSFVNEVSAIKWAMRNSVKTLVIEEYLATMSAEKFLYNYNKNVLSMPKVLFLGNKPRSTIIPISKLLSSGALPNIVATNVDALSSE